ncbi:hypothetical protein HYG77_04800 [Rhodococcus sp. ZPP]|uniref:hypothetical protein n=1 Tax=Rhodococcus sp. ZPP TaxID=2749906 RepID=UPI001AD8899B|nr:hypothetical protein [Rhodococcus sp. ZPP]QTJ64984.1 hypothetical protein HYG77_04800 [Rhodococcus sp. ZPP]
MTSTRLSAYAAIVGVVALLSGTTLLWGSAVALLVAGGLALAVAVALYDPADRRR